MIISAPKNLSPQERRLFNTLTNYMRYGATVFHLYCQVKGLSVPKIRAAAKLSHRKMQQHVGVLVQRTNAKQRRFLIKPGKRPRTYCMTRR